MTIRQSLCGTRCVLELSGRFDGPGAQCVQEAVDHATLTDGGELVLDFREVSFISSLGLRVLLLTRKRCDKVGAQLSLANLQPYCLEVLRVCGLERSFQIVAFPDP